MVRELPNPQIDREISRDQHQKLLQSLAARGLLLAKTDDKVLLGGEAYSVTSPDSSISGSARIDIGSKTAVIVDFDRDETLAHTYQKMSPAFDRIRNPGTRQEGLTGLTSVVDRLIPYNAAEVVNLYRTDYAIERQLAPHYLGEFINKHVGICSQQALLTAALLEHARDEKLLPAGTEVSVQSRPGSEQAEAHAFAYLAIDEQIWRLDPTQQRSERAILIE